jgi:hypothetical protein
VCSRTLALLFPKARAYIIPDKYSSNLFRPPNLDLLQRLSSSARNGSDPSLDVNKLTILKSEYVTVREGML